MILEAFAKINWSLDITGIREDGYHLMDMLMQPVSLSDEITLSPAWHNHRRLAAFPCGQYKPGIPGSRCPEGSHSLSVRCIDSCA